MQEHRSRGTGSPTPEELFGLVLREERKAKSLSQEELAFRSNYHPTYVGQLERGKKSPSLRTLFSLAAALEIPASDLVKGVEIRMVKRR